MSKRIISIALFFTILFSAVSGRCAYIMMSNNYAVAKGYNSKSYNICNTYTTIVDRYETPLNNNTKSLAAIVRPNEKDMSELPLLFNADVVKEITSQLKNGDVVIRKIDKYSNTKHIKVIEAIEENSPDMLCRHLIDRACGGLELSLGNAIGSVKINYSVDALGRILAGDNGTIINNNDKKTVKISIDSRVQKIAESSSKSIKKGAVVIADCNTSQILACYSAGEDYLNRASSNYAIGSIFKLVVCASALENNVSLTYKCENKIKVGDTTFCCQNNKAHGRQKMKQALANSCNCYFVKLALTLGAQSIYDTAKEFGFLNDIELYSDFNIKHGAFADLKELESKGQLALIGFGQGVLTDNPIHFSAVVSAIANGGIYNPPTLALNNQKGTRVMSESNAKKLREYMRYVVTNGTGTSAEYNNSSAGKTATAQSGIYIDEKEILNTFFVGFYPYDNPKYSIVVMYENGTSGAGDCSPIFSTIVENLEKI